MEYDEVLDKLVDKVLVLNLKRRKMKYRLRYQEGQNTKKHNELCLISVGMNTNTYTTLYKNALLDFCPWHKYKYKYNSSQKLVLPYMISVCGINTNTNTYTILHKDMGFPT